MNIKLLFHFLFESVNNALTRPQLVIFLKYEIKHARGYNYILENVVRIWN